MLLRGFRPARPARFCVVGEGECWAGWGRTLRISARLGSLMETMERDLERDSQSIESMTITLVRLSSGRPRSTLRSAGSKREWRTPRRRVGSVKATHFKMVSVCSLNALLIFALFNAAKPSGLRYAGQDVREYRPCRHK